MTIGITGATGQLGRLTVEALKKRVPASEIVALVRRPEKAADLGGAVRRADYTEPESLSRALDGIDTLLLISSNDMAGNRAAHHITVIEAAKAAGVRRIVYTSLLHADRSSLSLAEDHRQTEAALRSSGLAYTILRNGWYHENNLAALPGALAGGAFIGATGNGRISGATRLDFAEAAVAALIDEGHNGKTYELAGDTSWTMADLAAEVSRQTGKTIVYRDLGEAGYAAALEQYGVPKGVATAVASWDTAAANGALFDESRELSTLIGRPTTPLSNAIADALKGLGS
jgi:NAD(P)H dehydrogenase (quinone)